MTVYEPTNSKNIGRCIQRIPWLLTISKTLVYYSFFQSDDDKNIENKHPLNQRRRRDRLRTHSPYITVYPKKYAHGFVVLCFVVVMQSFIMNSHEVFIHIHQGCFAGTGAIVRLPQCQWSKPDGYGENHNKAQQSKNRVHISWDILYMNVIKKTDLIFDTLYRIYIAHIYDQCLQTTNIINYL